MIAASTHKGEEEQILSAFGKIREQHKDTLLLLVPRHPERFNDVHTLITSQNLSVARRSTNEPVTVSTDVILGDTMGEMMLLFSASDISFVGGSLVPVGGHNLLEPAAVGLPVISGPHLFNFTDVATTLKAANALSVVNNQEELADRIITLLDDETSRRKHRPGREAGRRTKPWRPGKTADTGSKPDALTPSSLGDEFSHRPLHQTVTFTCQGSLRSPYNRLKHLLNSFYATWLIYDYVPSQQRILLLKKTVH